MGGTVSGTMSRRYRQQLYEAAFAVYELSCRTQFPLLRPFYHSLVASLTALARAE